MKWKVFCSEAHPDGTYAGGIDADTAEDAACRWGELYDKKDDSCHLANQGTLDVRVAPEGSEEWEEFTITGYTTTVVELFED